MPTTRAIVKEYYGTHFLTDIERTLFDLPALEAVIAQLTDTVQRIKARGDTSPTKVLLQAIMQRADLKWTFLPTKKQIAQACACVYFLYCPEDPPFAKIGRSVNLANRLPEHYRVLSRDLVVLTIAETPESIQLEQALHYAFAPYRIGPELFEYDPVWNFLDDMHTLHSRKEE